VLRRPGSTLTLAGLACCAVAVLSRIANDSIALNRGLEGAALLLAGLACVTPFLSTPPDRRRLLPGSVLGAGFAVWAVVQIDPTLRGAPLLNDFAILLFVGDVALIAHARPHPATPAVLGRDTMSAGPKPARVAATDHPPISSPIAGTDVLVRSSRAQLTVAVAATLAAAAVSTDTPSAYPWFTACLLVSVGVAAVHQGARAARRARIHQLLAAGGELPVTPVVESEVLRLLSPQHREDLLHRLTKRLRDAQEWHRIIPTARPPASTRLLASYAPLVREIATLIVTPPAPPVRGIALLEVFLTDGGSALYQGDPDELGAQLQLIADALPSTATATDRDT
jgi:hypothetical protein